MGLKSKQTVICPAPNSPATFCASPCSCSILSGTMLSSKDHPNIRSYKYTGGDSSPLYAFVLSPIAQFCVDNFVPSWVAPNVITVAGLVLSFVATTTALIVNPTLGTDAPRWSHLLVGVCVFLYQTLDNMDGKQARKTGSSSALGMLIDHGCDALNSGVTTIGMASVLGLGWTQRLVFVYWSSMVLFYFQVRCMAYDLI